MPLNNLEIVSERVSGRLVIEPFCEPNLGSDTYDVCLGEHYYRERQCRHDQDNTYNLFDADAVQQVWGGDPLVAVPAPEFLGWCPGERVIWIEPGETILAHTVEFIGARSGYTTKMFSRSSVGRSMLGVCKCAGRGDVGYFNRWTMEITSFSRYHRIPLRVGMRVAQIEFLPVAESERVYGKTHGKYQTSDDLAELMRMWEPSMMLPKLSKDWDNPSRRY